MAYGYILPSIEVLIFNLLTAGHCFKRKYSLLKTGAALCAFTAAVLLLLIAFPVKAFDGRGRFTILGFVYIIPLKWLYDEKLEMLFLGMCMSWTYTLGIMALSIQTAYTLGPRYNDLFVTAIETVIFLATFIPFRKHIIPQYFYILRNTRKVQTTQFVFLRLNIYFHFFVLNLLHILFLSGERHLLQIAVLILFLACNCLFYRIVYDVINSSFQISELKKTVSNDALTGLGNRTKALQDMRALMDAHQVFSVIFLDLDRFKRINDQYGHDIGDRYLIHFGKVFSKELRDRGTLYRYAGDEFIVIYGGVLTEEAVRSMTRCKHWSDGAPCAFNRVSAGFVVCKPPYPDTDPSLILKRADSRMYRNKPGRKKM